MHLLFDLDGVVTAKPRVYARRILEHFGIIGDRAANGDPCRKRFACWRLARSLV
jgi:hypothetical protein